MPARSKSGSMTENQRACQLRPASGWCIGIVLIWIAILTFGLPQAIGQPNSDPALRIRALISQGHLDQAAKVVQEWLEADPQDQQARAWRARLLAWTNRWKEAEQEYSELIRLSPRDVDLLLGLAELLIWQRRYLEAMSHLEQAIAIDPQRMDCKLRRAQALQSLGRVHEARKAYQEILAQDGACKEARKGLEEIQNSKRHQFRFDSTFDSFNYAPNADSLNLALRSQWNSRLVTFASLHRHHRFGEKAAGLSAGAAINFSSRDVLTVGGSLAEENGVVPRSQAEFEYGHVLRSSDNGPIRGIETLYRQRWLWYRETRVLVLSPTAVVYLPKEWNWMVQLSLSRTAPGRIERDWKPSCATKLSFPIGNRVSTYFSFAAGVENFGYAEQIGQYSMRTWGAGLRIKIPGGQEILGYGHHQRYSGGRSLTSAGVGYVLRF